MSEIDKLPIDNHTISSQEKQVVDLLFKNTTTEIKKYTKWVHEFKEGLFIALLFLIFSLSFIDECIKKIIPISNNYSIIIYIIKIVLIIIIFWIFKNMNLLFTNAEEKKSH